MPSASENPNRQPLPDFVRRLIRQHLHSPAEIELLLLLFRSPETYWSSAAAANVVGEDDRAIRAHFAKLEAEGLLDRGKQSDAYRFAPQEPAVHAAVEALAQVYAERPEDVLRALAR